MSPIMTVLVSIVVLIVGIAIGYVLRKSFSEKAIGSAEQQAQNMILDAQNTVENLKKEKVLEAKEEIHKLRNEYEGELKARRAEISKTERRIQSKEENIDRKMESLEKRENGLIKKEQSMIEKHKEIDAYLEKQLAELERISGYTKEEAKHLLLQELETDIRKEASEMIVQIENEAKEEGDKKAREIITTAIQRYAADQTTESTVSVVSLPNDDMKGRIIGREGRNIRAIETLTGVDLIIDDTPEAVILSGFDPVRREIAFTRQGLRKWSRKPLRKSITSSRKKESALASRQAYTISILRWLSYWEDSNTELHTDRMYCSTQSRLQRLQA